MPKKRNGDSFTTTISILWKEKESLRRLAKPIRRTKNGIKFETDSTVFSRIIAEYISKHPGEYSKNVNPTYPSLQGKPQQD